MRNFAVAALLFLACPASATATELSCPTEVPRWLECIARELISALKDTALSRCGKVEKIATIVEPFTHKDALKQTLVDFKLPELYQRSADDLYPRLLRVFSLQLIDAFSDPRIRSLNEIDQIYGTTDFVQVDSNTIITELYILFKPVETDAAPRQLDQYRLIVTLTRVPEGYLIAKIALGTRIQLPESAIELIRVIVNRDSLNAWSTLGKWTCHGT